MRRYVGETAEANAGTTMRSAAGPAMAPTPRASKEGAASKGARVPGSRPSAWRRVLSCVLSAVLALAFVPGGASLFCVQPAQASQAVRAGQQADAAAQAASDSATKAVADTATKAVSKAGAKKTGNAPGAQVQAEGDAPSIVKDKSYIRIGTTPYKFSNSDTSYKDRSVTNGKKVTLVLAYEYEDGTAQDELADAYDDMAVQFSIYSRNENTGVETLLTRRDKRAVDGEADSSNSNIWKYEFDLSPWFATRYGQSGIWRLSRVMFPNDSSVAARSLYNGGADFTASGFTQDNDAPVLDAERSGIPASQRSYNVADAKSVLVRLNVFASDAGAGMPSQEDVEEDDSVRVYYAAVKKTKTGYAVPSRFVFDGDNTYVEEGFIGDSTGVSGSYRFDLMDMELEDILALSEGEVSWYAVCQIVLTDKAGNTVTYCNDLFRSRAPAGNSYQWFANADRFCWNLYREGGDTTAPDIDLSGCKLFYAGADGVVDTQADALSWAGAGETGGYVLAGIKVNDDASPLYCRDVQLTYAITRTSEPGRGTHTRTFTFDSTGVGMDAAQQRVEEMDGGPVDGSEDGADGAADGSGDEEEYVGNNPRLLGDTSAVYYVSLFESSLTENEYEGLWELQSIRVIDASYNVSEVLAPGYTVGGGEPNGTSYKRRVLSASEAADTAALQAFRALDFRTAGTDSTRGDALSASMLQEMKVSAREVPLNGSATIELDVKSPVELGEEAMISYILPGDDEQPYLALDDIGTDLFLDFVGSWTRGTDAESGDTVYTGTYRGVLSLEDNADNYNAVFPSGGLAGVWRAARVLLTPVEDTPDTQDYAFYDPGLTGTQEEVWTQLELGNLDLELQKVPFGEGGAQAVVADTEYTSFPLEPSVRLDGVLLAAGEYTAAYSDAPGVINPAPLAEGAVPVDAGSYVATISAAEDSIYTGSLVTPAFQIRKRNIRLATVSVADQVVGARGVPAVEVSYQVNGRTVTLGPGDYSLAYRNSAGNELTQPPAAVGSYEVVVTGTGNYEGVALGGDSSYTIYPAQAAIDLTRAQVADIPAQVYAGRRGVRPEPTVRAQTSGGETITLDPAALAFTYENNVNVTTADAPAKVNVKPAAETVAVGTDVTLHLVGTVSKEFQIVPYVFTEAAIDCDAPTFSAAPLEPELSVSVELGQGVQTLAAGVDYVAEYSDNVSAGEGTGKVTISGKGNFEGSTAQGSFSILPRNLGVMRSDGHAEVSFENRALVIPQMPQVGVSVSFADDAADYELQDGDFELRYESVGVPESDAGEGYPLELPARAGSYRLHIVGTGNFTGGLVEDFTLAELSLADASIGVRTGPCVYSAQEQAPHPVLERDGAQLVENEDYSIVSYGDNVNVGTGVVRLRGLGAYIGTLREVPFSITPARLDDAELSIDELHLGDDAAVPHVTVKIGGVALPDDDYTVSLGDTYYDDRGNPLGAVPTERGNYQRDVVVNAGPSGNCTGSQSARLPFAISSIPLQKVKVDGVEEYYLYTGERITPSVTLSYAGSVLEEGVDYRIGYGANTAASVFDGQTGTYPVGTITLDADAQGLEDGKCTGHRVIEFAICYPLEDARADLGSSALTYTGRTLPLAPVLTLGERTLDDGTKSGSSGADYTLSFKDAQGNAVESIVAAGAYAACFEGVPGHGYAGSKELSFTVAPAVLSAGNVELQNPDRLYDGEAYEPDLRVMFGERLLAEGSEYSIVYLKDGKRLDAAPAQAGSYVLRVVGEGNFSTPDTLEYNFSILTAQDMIAQMDTLVSEAKAKVHQAQNGAGLGEDELWATADAFAELDEAAAEAHSQASTEGLIAEDFAYILEDLQEAIKRFEDAAKPGSILAAQARNAAKEALEKAADVRGAAVASADGKDVAASAQWAPQAAFDALDAALAQARSVLAGSDVKASAMLAARRSVEDALARFQGALKAGVAAQALAVGSPFTQVTPQGTFSYTVIGVRKLLLVSARVSKPVAYTVGAVTHEGIAYAVMEVGPGAFSASKAAQVTVGQPVAIVASGAFKGSPGLKRLVLGPSVTEVGTSAFSSCKNLVSVQVGAGVRKLGKEAFSGCKKLKTLVLGKNVKTVGKSVLRGCKKLKKVTVKSTLLGKASCKNLLKGTKIRTVKIAVGGKKLNKKWVKTYKKRFPKRNAGKKLKVK